MSSIRSRVLEAVKRFPLTSIVAIEQCGTTRCAAYIEDLRKMGYVIRTDSIVTHSGKRVAQYNYVGKMNGDARGLSMRLSKGDIQVEVRHGRVIDPRQGELF